MSSCGPFELSSQTLGALPIVCRFLERMRLGELLERYRSRQAAGAGFRCKERS